MRVLVFPKTKTKKTSGKPFVYAVKNNWQTLQSRSSMMAMWVEEGVHFLMLCMPFVSWTLWPFYYFKTLYVLANLVGIQSLGIQLGKSERQDMMVSSWFSETSVLYLLSLERNHNSPLPESSWVNKQLVMRYYKKFHFNQCQQSQRVSCTEENDLVYLILQRLESWILEITIF